MSAYGTESSGFGQYSEFVRGMINVKRDPELSKVVPMDVPNRFMLLSLLIDTPINEDQEKLIMDKLEARQRLCLVFPPPDTAVVLFPLPSWLRQRRSFGPGSGESGHQDLREDGKAAAVTARGEKTNTFPISSSMMPSVHCILTDS